MPHVDAARLKDRRDELDLSMAELAKQVGVAYNYLSDVLNGRAGTGADGRRYGPSKRLIYRLSRVLDLPVEEIVVADEPPAECTKSVTA